MPAVLTSSFGAGVFELPVPAMPTLTDTPQEIVFWRQADGNRGGLSRSSLVEKRRDH